MSQLYINTVQNVRIEQTPSSIAERIIAQFIDFLLFGGYSLVFYGIIGNIAGGSITYNIIASLPIFFYHLICELTMNGQSAGKKVMGIRVVKDDGSQPNVSHFTLRWMFSLIEVLASFGSIASLTIVINGKGKRLGDIVAGTRVIRLKKQINHQGLLPEISEGYKPQFAEALNLNDNDIEIIREVLEFTKNNPNSPVANDMLFKTKTAIENKLQIRSDWYHYNFLEKIVKDYVYLSLNK